MDPFAERMLKRARARRDKLEAEASSVGVTISHNNTPLLDMDQAYNVKKAVSPQKNNFSPMKSPAAASPVKTIRASPAKLTREPSIHSPRKAIIRATISSEDESVKPLRTEEHYSDEEHDENNFSNKENGEDASDLGLRDGMRSRLKRLGALYSGSGELSSPIHRTENEFCVASEEVKPSAKNCARVARLAALATTINEWEDDLSHPSSGIPTKPDQRARNDAKPQEKRARPNFDKSGLSAPGRGPGRLSALKPNPKPEVIDSPKQLVWDKSLLASLESQGFTRTESRSRLVYDFDKDGPSSDLSPERLTAILEERGSPLRHGTPPRFGTPPRETTPTKRQSPALGSPQRRVNFASPSREREAQPFRVALKNVSGVDSSPAEGSVLQRAAQYEAAASPTQKPVRDPADLPLHERMALFEKNKGPLLVPKVPFSTPMPAKLLQEKGKSPQKTVCPPIKDVIANRAVKASPQKGAPAPAGPAAGSAPKPNKLLAKLQMFESGHIPSEESPSRPQVQEVLERQREVEMLANRWTRMREGSASTGVPPPPPPPPSSEPRSAEPRSSEPRSPARVTSMTLKSTQVGPGTPPPPPPMPALAKANESPRRETSSPRKSLFKEPKEYPGMGVKRIKTSPPKQGQLYPSLSDMEATTETESYTSADSSMSETESCSDTNSADCSFGRDLLAVAQQISSAQKSQSAKKGRFETSVSDVSITESNVLDDIDDYLDEAMGGPDSDSEGPSPSKRSRDNSVASTWNSGSTASTSAPVQKASPRSPYARPSPKRASPLKTSSPEDRSSQDEDYDKRPLMHTVSFYRRQQSARGTPVRQIVRHPTPEKVFQGTSSDATSSDGESCAETIDESTLVRERIKELRCELERQRTLIDQNSKYLNICLNTVEFPNFDGRVESERLLLVATQSHRAIQNEVTRLEVEKTLRPKGQGGRNGTQLIERGKLHIEEVTVPLKRDFMLSLAADDDFHHFVCVVKCNEQVFATSLISVEPGKGIQQDPLLGSVIRFKKELLLSNLFSNFTVTVEVYTMRTMKEKSHSKHHSKKDSSKHRMTPKKSKHDSVFVKPPLQSPAGPMSVRSSQFKMIGYVVFSLKEIHRTQFTLNKVVDGGTLRCPLQGSIHLKLKSDLSINIEEKGFLTMFEDVSGFGAWHRRWCVLKGEHLSYWKYPDDVSKKIAMGSIDLRTCITKEVGPVNREICARHNTFLLETTRPARPDDKDSLVTVCKRDKTIIRHLLSADSKEERIQWCNSLNKALQVMSAWGQKADA